MPLARLREDPPFEIWYESFGHHDDPPLVLVAGLGSQCLAFAEELCEGFVDRGFFVVRFDNRDTGLSSGSDAVVDLASVLAAFQAGAEVPAPYLLGDMAADVVALLDHLGIDAAHVLGVSMGGMIAQTMAIEHADRLLSLTSVMSTTGEPDVGQQSPEALTLLLEPSPTDRAGVIAQGLRWSELLGSPEHRDEERVAAYIGASYDRAHRPAGFLRQLLAVVASGSRADALAEVRTPTLVIHGTADRLIDRSGGERTAALIPGATLELIEGMGHDLPVPFWSPIIELVTRHAATAAGVN